MQKCSLCGGKVVNGRCEECGLPIPPENRYVLRSETAHTHEVNGEKILYRVRQAPDKKPFYTCPPERRTKPQTRRRSIEPRDEKRRAPVARFMWSIFVIVVVINLLPVLITSCSA